MEGTYNSTKIPQSYTNALPSLEFYHIHGRSISDYHLQEIAKYCCELEQLDILGTNKVTMDGVSM